MFSSPSQALVSTQVQAVYVKRARVSYLSSIC